MQSPLRPITMRVDVAQVVARTHEVFSPRANGNFSVSRRLPESIDIHDLWCSRGLWTIAQTADGRQVHRPFVAAGENAHRIILHGRPGNVHTTVLRSVCVSYRCNYYYMQIDRPRNARRDDIVADPPISPTRTPIYVYKFIRPTVGRKIITERSP